MSCLLNFVWHFLKISLNKMIKNDQNKSEKSKKMDTRVKTSARKLTWKENKELESIEEKIIEAEEEVKNIEDIFSSPDFYEKYAAQTNELNEKLENAKLLVKNLYQRWEELENIKNGE